MKQFLIIIAMATILLCGCREKSNSIPIQKPKEKEQTKVEIKTPTDKNDPEYYKQIFESFLYDPQRLGLSIKIDANKIYLRWEYKWFETVKDHERKNTDEYKFLQRYTKGPSKSIAQGNSDAIIDDIATALSLLQYAELPESISVNLEAYDVDIKSDNYGNETSKEVNRFKVFYDNKTIGKIFSAWKDGREVKIKSVAKSWYWNIYKD